MKNFSEELAYWYLRFNGFFLIDNFLIHDATQNLKGEIDLLAIRLPNSQEYIADQIIIQDQNLFNSINNSNRIIGLICEVKSNGYKRRRLNLLNNNIMNIAKQRLGLKNHLIYKILFHGSTNNIIERDDAGFLKISLNYVNNYLKEHIERYLHAKNRSKIEFSSNLIQYIIYEEYHNPNP